MFPNDPLSLRENPDTLNVLEQRAKSDFYKTIAHIMQFRQQYEEDRVVFIKGRDMMQIARGLGAREADFALLGQVSDGLHSDPTLKFRRARLGRYCYDLDRRTVHRMKDQGFRLSAQDDFVRHDSDQTRMFDEIQDDMQLNTVVQALMLFKVLFIHGVSTLPRSFQDYTSPKWIQSMFNLRTMTTPELQGEPALEGVHADGVDHTMTTLLGSSNMTDDSAFTFIHDKSEKIGIPNSQTEGSLVRGCVRHCNFLDTLLVVDNERFHSLTPVYQKDKDVTALRDMLILFTRKPALDGHVSAELDSTVPHASLHMEMPVWVP